MEKESGQKIWIKIKMINKTEVEEKAVSEDELKEQGFVKTDGNKRYAAFTYKGKTIIYVKTPFGLFKSQLKNIPYAFIGDKF